MFIKSTLKKNASEGENNGPLLRRLQNRLNKKNSFESQALAKTRYNSRKVNILGHSESQVSTFPLRTMILFFFFFCFLTIILSYSVISVGYDTKHNYNNSSLPMRNPKWSI